MKGLAARLLVFCLLLALLQVVVSFVFPAPVPDEIERLQRYLDGKVEILYFGDSTLTLPEGETTTGQLLQELLSDHTVGEIAHPAYNLDLYRHYVRYTARSAHQPQAIILPINIRSFSPEWDRRPGYQFEREKMTLDLGLPLARLLSRPLQTFGAFAPRVSEEAFLNTAVYYGDEQVGTVRDFESASASARIQGDTGFVYHNALPSPEDMAALEQALIYRYMFHLPAEHRQLQAMLDIVDLGRQHDIEILFYLTPINYQQGQRALGEDFVTTLSSNIDQIQSVLKTQAGREAIDLSQSLEAYAFVDMEHLREVGKIHVAEHLAQAIAPPPPPPPPTPTPTPMPATATPTPTRPPPPTSTLTTTATKPPTTVAPATATRAMGTTTRTAATATPDMTQTPLATTESQDLGAPGTVSEVEYLQHRQPGTGQYEVDEYRLWLRTRDAAGQIVPIRAHLYLPTVDTETEFSVLVHAAGTTGLTSRCAPLDEPGGEQNWGDYRAYSIYYAARGLIVILPNGLGFDDPERIHPYFISEMEAHVLLDAARAVYDLAQHPELLSVPAKPAEAVFMTGYSSGGHAVFAAKDWAARYAPDVPLKGVIGHGATTNLEVLLREDAVFSPYLVYAYRDFYGRQVIDPADVFLPEWTGSFEDDVTRLCVDGIFDYYSRSPRAMYNSEFLALAQAERLDEGWPLFAERLKANNAGLSGGADIPVLILQGTADTVVTPKSQRLFRDHLCEQGTPVTYIEYTAVAHFEIRSVSFGDTIWWMQNVARGQVPASQCSPPDTAN